MAARASASCSGTWEFPKMGYLRVPLKGYHKGTIRVPLKGSIRALEFPKIRVPGFGS